MTTTGAAGRRSRACASSWCRRSRAASTACWPASIDFICDVPPDQIPGIEKNAKFEVLGGTIVNHRLTVFDKNHPQLADPRIRQAFTHAIDRQAIVDGAVVGPHPRAGRPAVGILRRRCSSRTGRCRPTTRRRRKQLLKEANYKGDPIPYRLLNNYYTNQVGDGAGAGRDVAARSASTCQIEMKENWQQIFEGNGQRAVRDWSNSAALHRTRSPRSSRGTAPQASSSRSENGPRST